MTLSKVATLCCETGILEGAPSPDFEVWVFALLLQATDKKHMERENTSIGVKIRVLFSIVFVML
jgi:hypothetical protein